MSEVQTFEHDDFILGPDLPVSTTGYLAADMTAERLTPLMAQADGTLALWDGTADTAIGLTALATDAAAGDAVSYYMKGGFRASSVTWPQAAGAAQGDPARDLTDAEKSTAFAGTAIHLG
ncbi:head decoration protein [Pantoea agglomerans]|uniref:head decoration protein n=1 Tax=Enterobacter agglomerans TaxID=549 RepID=UPI0013B5E486|nr:head decoration protein [Pantoea agglomerans]NEG58194.1 head decoration protein [Pantoea agglomerans]NEG99907.1 head decoration protein [Pantoea agglomerans]NEH04130.1 head decoration protein [Pantoea agglomerans]NEH14467.1 head decoration protein [Pantoea agglomerans]